MKHLSRLKARGEKESLELSDSQIQALFAQGLTSEQILAIKRKEKKDKKDK
jgi:hypothetical protein